jgi:hypothetical protein
VAGGRRFWKEAPVLTSRLKGQALSIKRLRAP